MAIQILLQITIVLLDMDNYIQPLIAVSTADWVKNIYSALNNWYVHTITDYINVTCTCIFNNIIATDH